MQAHTCALKSWTIKKVDERFFIATTAQSRKHKWRGPYSECCVSSNNNATVPSRRRRR